MQILLWGNEWKKSDDFLLSRKENSDKTNRKAIGKRRTPKGRIYPPLIWVTTPAFLKENSPKEPAIANAALLNINVTAEPIAATLIFLIPCI